jgi:mRNA interferase YafQ
MKTVSQTTHFSRDVRRMRKRGEDLGKLKGVVQKLAQGEPLGPQYHDHPLSGDWRNCRDCHIQADWILIYTVDSTSLRLERTGTHSDLFE